MLRPSKRPLGLTAVPLYRVTMLAPFGEPCMASTLQQASRNGAGAACEQHWATAQQVRRAVCQCSSVCLEAGADISSRESATLEDCHSHTPLLHWEALCVPPPCRAEGTATATSPSYPTASNHLIPSNSRRLQAAGHTLSHRCHTPAGPAAHMCCAPGQHLPGAGTVPAVPSPDAGHPGGHLRPSRCLPPSRGSCPPLLQDELESSGCTTHLLALTRFREIAVVWVCPNRYTSTFSLFLDRFRITLRLPEPPALEPGRAARAALYRYMSLPVLSSCLQTTSFNSANNWHGLCML